MKSGDTFSRAEDQGRIRGQSIRDSVVKIHSSQILSQSPPGNARAHAKRVKGIFQCGEPVLLPRSNELSPFTFPPFEL